MAASNYPTSVWDGTSETRPDAEDQRAPDWADWNQIVAEVKAVQTQLKPLGINADGTLPTSDPSVAGQLWNSTGTVTVSAG